MLPMSALELRYPVAFIILMETNNAPVHTGRFRVCERLAHQLQAIILPPAQLHASTVWLLGS